MTLGLRRPTPPAINTHSFCFGNVSALSTDETGSDTRNETPHSACCKHIVFGPDMCRHCPLMRLGVTPDLRCHMLPAVNTSSLDRKCVGTVQSQDQE